MGEWDSLRLVGPRSMQDDMRVPLCGSVKGADSGPPELAQPHLEPS